MKHRTSHIQMNNEPLVICVCEACDWKYRIDVTGLSWIEGMEAIYAARDAHEADPLAQEENV